MEQRSVVDLSKAKRLYQLLKKSDQIYTNNCLDEAADLLEEALRHAVETFVPAILLKRAAIFEEKRDHTSAIKELVKMIQDYPKASLGYLHASRLLRLHGNLGEAIVVLEKGVKTIPSSDPLYVQLLAQRARVANEIRQKNMKFLDRLSCELFNRIFGYLDLRDRVRCAATCKDWRKRFDEWPEMWSTVDFTATRGGGKNYMFDDYTRFIPTLAGKRVRSIINRRPFKFGMNPFKLFCDHKIQGIQTIKIFQAIKMFTYDLIYLNRATLTSLAIYNFESRHDMTRLKSVLINCPNLSYLCLRLSGPCVQEEFTLPLQLALTQLHITATEHELNEKAYWAFLSTLISHSPRLEALGVDGDDLDFLGENLIMAVNQCPSLGALYLRGSIEEFDKSVSRYPNIPKIFSMRWPWAIPEPAILYYLKPRLGALQELELYVHTSPGCDFWRAIKDVGGFPNVERLRIEAIYCGSTHEELKNAATIANLIISSCPNLQRLYIADFFFDGVDILQTLGTLQQLTDLYINRCGGFNPVQMQKFAVTCTTLTSFTTEINITTNVPSSLIIRNILLAASLFTKLQHLQLQIWGYGQVHTILVDDIQTFVSALRSTRLSRISISLWNCKMESKKIIWLLATIPSLKHLIIHGAKKACPGFNFLKALERNKGSDLCISVYDEVDTRMRTVYYQDSKGEFTSKTTIEHCEMTIQEFYENHYDTKKHRWLSKEDEATLAT